MADVNSTQYDAFTQSGTGVAEKVSTTDLGGRVRIAVASVSDVSDIGSGGDKLFLTKLPRNAKIVQAFIHSDGALDGSATDEDIGFDNNTDALFDGIDASSAVSQTYRGGSASAVSVGDLAKEVWELAGYSSKKDAPAQVPVVLEASTGYGNTAAVEFQVEYVVD